jgi:hypothetical protein
VAGDVTRDVASQCARIKIVSTTRCRPDEKRNLLARKIFVATSERTCGPLRAIKLAKATTLNLPIPGFIADICRFNSSNIAGE